MNQNKPLSTTAAASEAKKTHIPARELTPLPSFLKYLGLSSTEEVPGFIPPVFSVDNPRACRPEGWKPETTPAFLEGMNLVREISKVRMFVSSNPYDFYVTAPGGGCVLENIKPDGSRECCTVTEVPGTETNHLFEKDWEALRNPALRATTDVELLLDSVEMGRMVFKTILDHEEQCFVMIEKEEM